VIFLQNEGGWALRARPSLVARGGQNAFGQELKWGRFSKKGAHDCVANQQSLNIEFKSINLPVPILNRVIVRL
jgi:hypothetical protein